VQWFISAEIFRHTELREEEGERDITHIARVLFFQRDPDVGRRVHIERHAVATMRDVPAGYATRSVDMCARLGVAVGITNLPALRNANIRGVFRRSDRLFGRPIDRSTDRPTDQALHKETEGCIGGMRLSMRKTKCRVGSGRVAA